MEQRIVVVTWNTQTGHKLIPAVCQVASEALRVAVWRAGGIALACRVTQIMTRMVIQIPAGHDVGQFIAWTRAAARFAVARTTNDAPPPWEEAYTYYAVSGVMVADEITACLTLPPQPPPLSRWENP